MPASFEEPSIQNEQEEKTPEEIKKEKALLLVEKINEIQAKPKKTKEDYEEIIRLAEKIKKIYSPEKQEGFAPDEVLDHILHVREITSKNIIGVKDIHKRPDGTLAGRVYVEGKWLPFQGDTLIETIQGKEITGASDIHSQPDGTLAGQVYVEGKLLPFKGDTLIETIQGKEITSASDIHSQPDGTLAGQVYVEGKWHDFLYGEYKEVLF